MADPLGSRFRYISGCEDLFTEPLQLITDLLENILLKCLSCIIYFMCSINSKLI
jgi:hypothetical protein